MLLQVAITNYRSFRETTVLSLVPVDAVRHTPDQTVETGAPSCPRALRAAVIYGPNGAGKSNLIKALSEVELLLRFGTCPVARPFRLNGAGPISTIEVEFVMGARHYAYGIAFAAGKVAEEWLVEPGAGDRQVFHRTANAPWWEAIDCPDDIRPAVIALARHVPDEQGFLYGCGVAGLGEFAEAQAWFRRNMWLEATLSSMWEHFLLRDADVREHATSLLADAGVGDVGIGFAIDTVTDEGTLRRLVDMGVSVGQSLPADRFAALAELPGVGVSTRILRRSADGQLVSFLVGEESDGTRRLLELADWHLAVGKWSNTVGIVDEVERSLHPLVVQRLFERLLGGPGRGQLVATTHDVNLLDLKLLPADSVWFAQKGPDGATQLYSLAEFDAAQLAALSAHLEEGYLAGRFGAIPFVGDSARLGWRRP